MMCKRYGRLYEHRTYLHFVMRILQKNETPSQESGSWKPRTFYFERPIDCLGMFRYGMSTYALRPSKDLNANLPVPYCIGLHPVGAFQPLKSARSGPWPWRCVGRCVCGSAWAPSNVARKCFAKEKDGEGWCWMVACTRLIGTCRHPPHVTGKNPMNDWGLISSGVQEESTKKQCWSTLQIKTVSSIETVLIYNNPQVWSKHDLEPEWS